MRWVAHPVRMVAPLCELVRPNDCAFSSFGRKPTALTTAHTCLGHKGRELTALLAGFSSPLTELEKQVRGSEVQSSLIVR